MKKGLVLTLAVSMLALTLAGCGKSGARTTFTIGFDADFPPYGYMNEAGEYVGFDLDLGAEVAKRNGWEIKYQPIDWDSKDIELSSGNIDCIWNGFTMSEDRIDQYEWSTPYVDNSQVFVVAKSTGITDQAGLAGHNVAVQTASSALEALQSDDCKDLLESFSELTVVPDYNTAFLNLESGAVDAIAMDIGVAKYQIEQRGDEYMILDQPLVSEEYGVGFLKGNTELRDTVQKTLDEMAADGKFAEIAEKWDLSDCVVLGK